MKKDNRMLQYFRKLHMHNRNHIRSQPRKTMRSDVLQKICCQTHSKKSWSSGNCFVTESDWHVIRRSVLLLSLVWQLFWQQKPAWHAHSCVQKEKGQRQSITGVIASWSSGAINHIVHTLSNNKNDDFADWVQELWQKVHRKTLLWSTCGTCKLPDSQTGQGLCTDHYCHVYITIVEQTKVNWFT